MSTEVLAALQEAHAFDPFPTRDDLGIYHVPFQRLVGAAHLEDALSDASRRFERVAVVGDSGTGKSSLTASVLGPLVEGIAPVLIPVAIEPDATVSEPRAMFAHIAAVISRAAAEGAGMSDSDREAALARLTAQRPVGRTGGRGLRLAGGWMGATLSAELSKQAGPPQSIARSASEALEVVHQMLAAIHRENLVPVLVFDDTDRWLRGSAFADPGTLARSFFGRVLPALADLRCAVVVAVHREYLTDDGIRGDVERALDTRLEVPTLGEPGAIAEIIASRVRAHLDSSIPALRDVMTDEAIERLFQLYQTGLRGELRGVLRTAHAALTEACDTGTGIITDRLISAAYSAWDSS